MIYQTLFDNAFHKMEERGWDYIAIAVDLHDTVFKATYSTELSTEYYPYAKEALQLLTADPRVLMYMYTCSPVDSCTRTERFFLKDGIYMSAFPQVVMTQMGIKDTDFQDFSEKPYFNILLEDKAGFDPNKDWELILEYLTLKHS